MLDHPEQKTVRKVHKNKVKVRKQEAVAADQRHLDAKNSILIAPEMENGWRETVRKLAQAHGMSTQTVHVPLTRS
jgi:hypothetical protein